jgi:hypothetical protein
MDPSEITEPVAAILTSAFAIIVCFGGVTNLLVVITHIKYRKKLMRDTKDILTFSLAFGDFVMSAMITPLPFSSAIAKKWTTGRNGCVIYGLITTWIGLSSILQLSCIALERFYTLSRLNASRIFRLKRSVQIIASCWLIAFLSSSLPLFGFSQFTLEGYGLHCSIVWKKSHIWYCMFLLFFFYVLPIITIAISYAKIFLVVRKVHRNAEITWGSNAHVTRQSYRSQMKFTKQLVVVTIGFLIAWTPYAVMSTVRVITDMEFENAWYELPALFAKTANIYNPVIYFFMYKRLRRHVSMILNEARNSLPSISFNLTPLTP